LYIQLGEQQGCPTSIDKTYVTAFEEHHKIETAIRPTYRLQAALELEEIPSLQKCA